MWQKTKNWIKIITGIGVVSFLVVGGITTLDTKSLDEKVRTATLSERVAIKSDEILKVVPKQKYTRDDYTIEIVNIQKFADGVDVYARAWVNKGIDIYAYREVPVVDSNEIKIERIYQRTINENHQIGFGDGTVDIERFRIQNPPVLVSDPNGKIIRTGEDGSTERFREDPLEAILQEVERGLRLNSDIKDGSAIVPNKVGNTTYSLRSDVDTGATTVDGRAFRIPSEESFSSIWTGAGTGFNINNTWGVYSFIRAGTTSGLWDRFDRTAFTYDSSTVTGGISSVTWTLTSRNATVDGLGLDTMLAVSTSTLASNNAVVSADYAYTNWGDNDLSLRYGIDPFDASDVARDFPLNSLGLGVVQTAVDASGIISLGLRADYDIDNVEPVWGSGLKTEFDGYFADNTGTTFDPVLTIITTTAGTAFSSANWSGYDEATWTNPASAIQDFTGAVLIANLTASFDSNVQSDGCDIRVTKEDGTELPFDLINWAYNAGSPTGQIRLKWTGTLASSGTQNVRIWAGYTGGTAGCYATGEPYGQYNAYDGDWQGYWPGHDFLDRTYRGLNLTESGTVSTTTASAKFGNAFVQSSTANYLSTTSLIDFDEPLTILGWWQIDTDGVDYVLASAAVSPAATAFTNGSFAMWFRTSDNVGRWSTRNTSSYQATTPDALAINTWGFFGGRELNNSSRKIRLNGGTDGAETSAADVTVYVMDSFTIGTLSGYSDEVQLHSVARSDAWLLEEYNQTNNNSTFWGTWAWTDTGVTPAVPKVFVPHSVY